MRLIIAILVFLPSSVFALDISDAPICFVIKNEAPYMVYGDISTNYQENENGTKVRHTATFRLQKLGTNNDDGFPLDETEICSQGPFYPGRQLELTIRTLIPIFSCKTNIEIGEIIIKGKINDDGTTKTWAVCY